MKVLLLISSLFLMTSCFKTAEDLEREKLLSGLNTEMKQSQGLVADMTIKLKEFEERVSQVNGSIEQIEHRQQTMHAEKEKNQEEKIRALRAQVEQLNQTIEIQKKQIQMLNQDVEQTKKFIQDLTKSLKGGSAVAPKAKTSEAKSRIHELIKMVDKGQYNDAEIELNQMINSNISNPDKNKAYHELGRIHFFKKNYDNSLVFFSKIYTNYPSSSLAPSSLLFISKCLKNKGMKDEAKQTLTEFTQKFPKSSLIAEVNKELKSL
jgi:TolA-binding protein